MSFHYQKSTSQQKVNFENLKSKKVTPPSLSITTPKWKKEKKQIGRTTLLQTHSYKQTPHTLPHSENKTKEKYKLMFLNQSIHPTNNWKAAELTKA